MNLFTISGQHEEWKLRAACRDHPDPDLWFPDSNSHIATRPAVQICRICPVVDKCIEFADSKQIPYGIWGGVGQRERAHTVTAQRRATRQRQARQAAGRAG